MQACRSCGTTTEQLGRFCPSCGGLLGNAGSTRPLPRSSTSRSRDPSASLIGDAVGDFAIEAVIGTGSFGTVYRGRQLGLDRAVAIKVPSHEIAADPKQARRFAREARAAARIVHPGVVTIYAIGELADGRPYLVMQLIDGEPLDKIFRDGPVPPLRALRIARNIASALSDTHAAGVVHRDLKPSNIMWHHDRNGDDRITLVDFGIAVCKPGNADATRLTAGGLLGTPHYMSPEQAHGEQVDGRADLYGLGCVLFELVTGGVPFEGAGFEVIVAHLGQPTPLASERNPGVPAAVDRLITALMAKRPIDRPSSADAVVAMIDDAIDELAQKAPVSSAIRRAGAGVQRDGDRSQFADPSASQSSELPHAHPRPATHAELTAPDLVLARHNAARRWAAVAAIGVLALSGAGFAAFRLRGAGGDDPETLDATAASAAGEPLRTAGGALVSASGEPLRLIPRDDGELIIRTTIPEVIHANTPVRAHLEIKTKLGGQFSARQVVVTIEDPHHNATAQTAAVHDARPGHYAFQHTFAEPGAYVVRIFPSETETVSTIELGVVP